MVKGGRFGKYGDKKQNEKRREQNKTPKRPRATFKLEEHYKISPKHPGKGRK